ncbi:MAG: hypothetical protein GEU96_07595, partial [Propionibacteriales bacterium]|nr:hypothetical protein [Propionibacteriales bacterium]
MPDRDPIAELSALAREGQDLATPLPADDVRARGARRHRRRVATSVAAACLAVALCAGAAVAAAGNVLGTAPEPAAPTPTTAPTPEPTREPTPEPTREPTPDPTLDPTSPSTTPSETAVDPRPDPEPAVELTEDNRLAAGDIAWGPQMRWRSTGLTESFESNDTGCYTDVLDGLSEDQGLTGLWHEKFRNGAEDYPQVEAVTMQFGSVDDARAVYDQLLRSADDCAALIRGRGDVPKPDQDDSWRSVTVHPGEAQFM